MNQFLVICQIFLISCAISDAIATEDECAVGHYQCQGSVKKCIELTAICDGKKDCPNGEDEITSYCKESSRSKQYVKYNPGQNYANGYVKQESQIEKHSRTVNSTNEDHGENRYWPNNGCGAGNEQFICLVNAR